MVRYEVSRWKFVDNDVDERVDDIDDVDVLMMMNYLQGKVWGAGVPPL